MYPLVLSHELISTFSFLHNGTVREGMCSDKELYCLYKQFAATDRQKAFAVAMDLAETGALVCVTSMLTQYKVWVSLRTLDYVSLLSWQGANPEDAIAA